MPLYIDVHRNVEGLTVDVVEEAHQKDLEVQDKHTVNYLRYCFNEDDGAIFCLYKAPKREAADQVHRESHGFATDEIIEGSCAATEERSIRSPEQTTVPGADHKTCS